MKKQTKSCYPVTAGPLRNLLGNLFKKILFFVLIHMVCVSVYAQQKIHVTGMVKDDKGAPSANSSVIVKGTSTGVTTDGNGVFSIDVPNKKSVLVISNTGYQSQEVVVGSNTNFNIDLAVVVNQLNEVVVVGYGTQKKVTVTGAVSAIKGDVLVKSPAVDMTNSLAGRLPGLVVIQSSGEPGYDGATVSIRGTNTLGNNSPLIVIDGIPDRDGGLGRLNPRDVESISVLKDASAAIYGARAARGG